MARRLSRGDRNIAWIERHCRVPEGKDVGKPVRLRPWQKKIIRRIYNTPTRMAIISFGRKNAKSTLTAMLLILHLVGPESRPNSNLASGAQSRKQAAILFTLARKMINQSPTLSHYITVKESEKQLVCRERGTVYEALSSDATTALGRSDAFVAHDELGAVKGPRSDLFDNLETGVGAQDSPLSVVISTQAPTDGDLLSILIDDAQAGHDPEIKLFLYTAPEDADPFAVKTIRAANPAFGDFLNAKEVKAQAEKARRMPAREAKFRNLVLNQRISQESPFVAPATWKANGAEPLEAAFSAGHVQIGLDLSARHDLTAMVTIAELEGETHVRPLFFLPGKDLDDRALEDRVPYDLWRDQGHLIAVPGASVDYDLVAAHLVEICETYDVSSIAFDRWRIDVLEAALERIGVELPLRPHGQGYKDMSPALDHLEAELLNHRVRHGMHPVMNMCAANAIVDMDPAGNRKLNKAKSTGRIDGMVALAMAMHVAEAEEYVTGTVSAL